jgi:hypothetical protein
MTTEQRNAVETMLVKLKSYRLQMMSLYESLADGDPDKTRMAVRITCLACALHTPGEPLDAYD